jgi:SAM-dependent methyltransferase
VPPPLLNHVAASLDAPRALGPHLATLFEGLVALGSMPGVTARLLQGAGIRRRHRVLDLACGKGAVAVELAARTGCRVVGLDAYEPFIAAADALAARRGVAERCTFRFADIRALGRPARLFDAALMVGLDPLECAAPRLRALVRIGGLYVIDDCHRNPRHPAAHRFTTLPTRSERHAFIGSLGDRVVAVHVPSPSAIRRSHERLSRVLSGRAAILARERPALRPHLREFLGRHRDAGAILSGPLRPAVWVVRRGPADARG